MKDETTEKTTIVQDTSDHPFVQMDDPMQTTSGEISCEIEESFNLKRKLTNAAVSCALIFAILLCIGVLSQVLSKGYVSIGRYSLFRVVTGSMEPAIPVGSLLVSQKVDIDQIQVGDIVNYRSRDMGMLGMTITHRVVDILKNENGQIFLETKGDANQYSDGRLVNQQNLIGKTIYYTKEGNFVAGVLSFLTSSVGFLACIVLPCLLVGVFTMRDCVNGLREEMDVITKQLDEMNAVEKQPDLQSQQPEESTQNAESAETAISIEGEAVAESAETTAEPEKLLEQQLGEEAYRELCARLKDELLEELKQGAEKNDTTEEPGADHQ